MCWLQMCSYVEVGTSPDVTPSMCFGDFVPVMVTYAPPSMTQYLYRSTVGRAWCELKPHSVSLGCHASLDQGNGCFWQKYIDQVKMSLCANKKRVL